MVAPEELHEKLVSEGGFSVSPAGNWAHSGTMVSRAGTEVAHAGIAHPSQIADYQNKHADLLSKPGYYFGAWVEPKAGNPNLRPGSPVPRKETVLDISQRFPAGHADAANLQGAIHSQRAVFNVNSGEVKDITPVLPMDYSHMDIEQIHSPRLRGPHEYMGERLRRQQRPEIQQLVMPYAY